MSESLFGINIVESEYGDISDEGIELFNSKFLLNSLKKYDGKAILINLNWDIAVYEDNGDILCKFNIIENEEFKTLLKNIMNVKERK